MVVVTRAPQYPAAWRLGGQLCSLKRRTLRIFSRPCCARVARTTPKAQRRMHIDMTLWRRGCTARCGGGVAVGAGIDPCEAHFWFFFHFPRSETGGPGRAPYCFFGTPRLTPHRAVGAQNAAAARSPTERLSLSTLALTLVLRAFAAPPPPARGGGAPKTSPDFPEGDAHHDALA